LKIDLPERVQENPDEMINGIYHIVDMRVEDSQLNWNSAPRKVYLDDEREFMIDTPTHVKTIAISFEIKDFKLQLGDIVQKGTVKVIDTLEL
jgi:hypothetical protein